MLTSGIAIVAYFPPFLPICSSNQKILLLITNRLSSQPTNRAENFGCPRQWTEPENLATCSLKSPVILANFTPQYGGRSFGAMCSLEATLLDASFRDANDIYL